ncbi:MAG: hypothetical protein ACLQDL_05415 [Spirochaetia bacterium]
MERIGHFFLRISVMTSEEITEVLGLQAAGDKRPFGEIALSKGFVDVQAIKAYEDFARGEIEELPPE